MVRKLRDIYFRQIATGSFEYPNIFISVHIFVPTSETDAKFIVHFHDTLSKLRQA